MSIPSTYRMQLTSAFGFDALRGVLPYLAELGAGAVYASPVFQCRRGSEHGYDVVDPDRINTELGGEPAFDDTVRAAHALGLGWLQDVVPNHMAYDADNRYLMDVLENGPGSKYAAWFDILWDHPNPSLRNRLLAPFLGVFYHQALEEGQIRLVFDEDGLGVRYFDWRLPLRLESYPRVFGKGLRALARRLGETHPDVVTLQGLLAVTRERREGRDRADAFGMVKRVLAELAARNERIREYLEDQLRRFQGKPGRPESFQALDALLEEQHFRLAFWKVAGEEINYRRFFSINQLICLRKEDVAVRERTHRTLFGHIEAGRIDGLRVDHVDGLHDPGAYLRRLRDVLGARMLVVEKILDSHEDLPDWPVDGTTGYDFLFHLNNLFCRTDAEPAFDRLYARIEGFRTSLAERVNAKKRLIIGKHLAGDVDNLAHLVL